MAAKMGLPRFAAKQMAQWLYPKHVTSVDEMTNLPKAAREDLKTSGYEVGYREPLTRLVSKDGTEKYQRHHIESFVPLIVNQVVWSGQCKDEEYKGEQCPPF